jgi:hypothetical protein
LADDARPLTVRVAPPYFGIGTGEQFHLGEPLPLGACLVEEVEGEAGLDYGPATRRGRWWWRRQQPGAEQSCSREHVGAFRGGMCRRRYFRCDDRPRADRSAPDAEPPPDPYRRGPIDGLVPERDV